MYICIGGCWHGSKVLQNQKSNYFVVKDKASGELTRYEKYFINFSGETHAFWVAHNINYLEINDMIIEYLEKIQREIGS